MIECDEMLSLRLSKGLSLVMFHVTHTSWGFLWIFCRRFIVFSILFLLNFITGVCPEITCSIVLHFVGMTFIAVQLTGCCMMPDLGVRNLGTYCKKLCYLR